MKLKSVELQFYTEETKLQTCVIFHDSDSRVDRTQRGVLSPVAGPGNTHDIPSQALIPNVCQAWFQNVLGLAALLSFHFLPFETMYTHITIILGLFHYFILREDTLFSSFIDSQMGRICALGWIIHRASLTHT